MKIHQDRTASIKQHLTESYAEKAKQIREEADAEAEHIVEKRRETTQKHAERIVEAKRKETQKRREAVVNEARHEATQLIERQKKELVNRVLSRVISLVEALDYNKKQELLGGLREDLKAAMHRDNEYLKDYDVSEHLTKQNQEFEDISVTAETEKKTYEVTLKNKLSNAKQNILERIK